jgi:hypothetical protein
VWLMDEARRKCLTAVKDGNCFVEGSNFAAVNRVAARLHQENAIGRLRSLCERALLGPRQTTSVPLAYGFFCATYDFLMAAYFYTRRNHWHAAWRLSGR